MARRIADFGIKPSEPDEIEEEVQEKKPKKKKEEKKTAITEDVLDQDYEVSKIHNGLLEFVTLVRVVMDDDLKGKVWPRLEEDHFASDAVSAIFRRLKTLDQAGKEWPKLAMLAIDPALPPTSRSQLASFISRIERGQDPYKKVKVGDSEYPLGTPSDIENFAFNVLDSLRITRKGLEQFISATKAIADDVEFDPLQGPGLVENAATEVLRLRGKESVADCVMHFGHGITEADIQVQDLAFRKIIDNDKPKIRTGWEHLDAKMGGFQPGEVVLLGGTTGSGKTVSMLSMMVNQARLGISSAMLNLELTKEQTTERLASNISNIDSYYIRTGQLTEAHMRKIMHSKDEFNQELVESQGRLTIFTPSSATIQECEYAFKSYPYQVWYIDYVNLLQENGGTRSGEDWGRLSDIVKEFKRIAKRYGIVIVLAVQVNIDKVSGAIEIRYAKAMKEHADVVIVWNLTQEARDDGVVTFHHLKARQYEPFDFPMKVNFKYCRFDSMAMMDFKKNTTLGAKARKLRLEKRQEIEQAFPKKSLKEEPPPKPTLAMPKGNLKVADAHVIPLLDDSEQYAQFDEED